MPHKTRQRTRLTDRPFIIVNMAMSADGKIAAPDSGFSRFGSPRDTANLYRIRQGADGILSGSETIRLEQATLTTDRDSPKRNARQKPLRILATGRGTLSTKTPFFQVSGPPILILTTRRIGPKRFAAYQDYAAGIFVSESRSIDWSSALKWLRQRWHIRTLVCEGGATLNQSLFRLNYVDELNLTLCPLIIGGKSSPTIATGTPFPSLQEAAPFQLIRRRVVNRECFLTYRRLPVATAAQGPQK
tara:strand:- start:253 stop:987 length:735 start_codon:yes stop_codon:yes gene_type:complete